MIVQLNSALPNYPELSVGQPYLVIGVEADDLRVLNDQGRPYLYPRELFTVIDSRVPQDWITERGEDGEQYAYPPQLVPPGFFEDFFDGIPEVVATFWRVMNRRLAAAA
jgi:hypothetical protein